MDHAPGAPAPSAAETAYAHTKAALLNGELAAGSMVSEGDVATRLGLSRTPVREAFLRLAAEGWLRLFPKRGALVIPPEPGEANDILSARLLLERAGAEAASREPHDAAALASQLETLLLEQRSAHESGDLGAFTEADLRFHRCITLASGNRLLLSFHESLNDRERRMHTRSLWGQGAATERVLAQHAQLIVAIADRDPDRFAAALEEHLRTVHARLL